MAELIAMSSAWCGQACLLTLELLHWFLDAIFISGMCQNYFVHVQELGCGEAAPFARTDTTGQLYQFGCNLEGIIAKCL